MIQTKKYIEPCSVVLDYGSLAACSVLNHTPSFGLNSKFSPGGAQVSATLLCFLALVPREEFKICETLKLFENSHQS